MINPFKDTNWHPAPPALRGFGRSLMLGFPIIAVVFLLVLFWRTHQSTTWPLWLGGIGFVAGLLFWAVPAASKPFYYVWYFLACCLGLVVSNTLVAVIYYAVLTPVALLRRLVGRDPMERRWEPEARSYWKTVEHTDDSRRHFSQY